ncbi:hypothetical protein PG984_005263 [Apiospora sp. TS-2023a]
MPSQPPNHEPVVKVSSPLPKGYIFVPKGNVYITANCRRLTQAAKKTVYAVINHQRRSLGIRVPTSIHAQVVQDERASRADRTSAVQKRDAAMEKQFREAILDQFPKTPAASVPLVVKRAMLKGSRRVGRTGKLDIETKAKLAVRAHIRHTHTDYDGMLKAKTHTKNQARDVVLAKIDEVAKSWGGKVDEHRRNRPQKRKDTRKDRGKEKDHEKRHAKGVTKSGASAKQQHGQNTKEGENSSGRRTSSLVKNKSLMQVKKMQVRLARQDSGNSSSNPAKAPAKMGTSLRPYTIDSSGDELDDDESDEFEWCESDDDDVNSDSDWAPDDFDD